MLVDFIFDVSLYIVAMAAGVGGKVIYDLISKKMSGTDHDAEVYKKYRGIFSEKAIYFLRNESFSNHFSSELDSVWSALDSRRICTPDYTFHDGSLKKLSDEVIEASYKLARESVKYTFPIPTGMFRVEVGEQPFDPESEKRIAKILELDGYCKDLVSKLDALYDACNRCFSKKI